MLKEDKDTFGKITCQAQTDSFDPFFSRVRSEGTYLRS